MDQLQPNQRKKVIDNGTLLGSDVFWACAVEVGNSGQSQESSTQDNDLWNAAYRKSNWFEFTYRILSDSLNVSLEDKEYVKALNYRVDEKRILWKHHNQMFLSCILESKVLAALRAAHDDGRHWAKQRTLVRLWGLVYWPSMSIDVERYIRGCLSCALHGLIVKSQFLHLVRVLQPFQLIGFNFVGLLPITKRGCNHIFHVINYLFRFSITFFTMTVNAEDVILTLKKVFTLYIRPEGIYCDKRQHFNNSKVKSFLFELEILIAFNRSDAHQNIEMMKMRNRLFQNVLRKTRTEIDWEEALSRSIFNLNVKLIFHLEASFVTILLGILSNTSLIDLVLKHHDIHFITSWAVQLRDSDQHIKAVKDFLFVRRQLHDSIRARSDQRKENEVTRFNRKITPHTFSFEDLMILYQEKSEKLKPRWRGPFIIQGFGREHEISYHIKQLNGRKIRGTFHGNHLKVFIPKTSYLADPSMDLPLMPYQPIRRPRKKKT